jgi:hypothetical protein
MLRAATLGEASMAALHRIVAEQCGAPSPLRLSEHVTFVDGALLQGMAETGRTLIESLVADRAYREAAQAAIPDPFRTESPTEGPVFATADFALDDAGPPMLLGLQGFPGLTRFAEILAQSVRTLLPDGAEAPYLDGLTEESFGATLETAIRGGHAADDAVQLVLLPEENSARADFQAVERRFGTRAVCITQVRKIGRKLYAPNGRPILRATHRVRADELPHRRVSLPFDWRDALEIEWAGHPSWQFLLGPFALPHLNHPQVLQTHFLSQLTTLPDDLKNWVLRPWTRTPGGTVTLGPTRAHIAGVEDPTRWLLQRRAFPGTAALRTMVRIHYAGQPALRALLATVYRSADDGHPTFGTGIGAAFPTG